MSVNLKALLSYITTISRGFQTLKRASLGSLIDFIKIDDLKISTWLTG